MPCLLLLYYMGIRYCEANNVYLAHLLTYKHKRGKGWVFGVERDRVPHSIESL